MSFEKSDPVKKGPDPVKGSTLCVHEFFLSFYFRAGASLHGLESDSSSEPPPEPARAAAKSVGADQTGNRLGGGEAGGFGGGGGLGGGGGGGLGGVGVVGGGGGRFGGGLGRGGGIGGKIIFF